MELNDILEKLSLPQDLTRRGFLKAASAAAALGHLNPKLPGMHLVPEHPRWQGQT
ncbi:twin-arginine translocation signal domain-containing protein [Sutterella wadsworthensis]|uniref:twin-arginine translocation signal domain-containing protein n=1 Tax=Sutterella wadsworthensis TaxID=40545 RepID=UPI00242AA3FD|nr:twin-arginine translocation signal domain-containing protein [Sutterella wadsworthensis]